MFATSVKIRPALALALRLLLLGAIFAGPTAAFADTLEKPAVSATVQKSHFGNTPAGADIDLYTLTNSHGLVCKIITYGGIITELRVPDRRGNFANVVLGHQHWADHLDDNWYFGAICGRVANRISGSRFALDGHAYTLSTNSGTNQLHGGRRGFSRVLWHAETTNGDDAVSLRLTYTSPDGEEGYPGTLQATVTYTLTDSNELRLDFEATTDKPTPVNLCNHTYWNLAGQGEITNQVLTINAGHYTPADDSLIPTGEIAPVKGTPLDFTTPASIGSHLARLEPHPFWKNPAPLYDNNFVLDGGGKKFALAARAFDPESGRVLEVWTDQAALQLFTPNFSHGNNGQVYKDYAAFCLETQGFPDAVNHPKFPQSILRPGEIYHHTTVWRFSTK